jgi:hypothetical protein
MELSSSAEEYCALGYRKIYTFLDLKKEQYPLLLIQLIHLRKYYMTIYDIPININPEFRQMEISVQL